MVIFPAAVLILAATLPTGFPLPLPSPANPSTAARVELGRLLFHDKRLSANGTQACATCHQRERAFTDGRATALGSTGQSHTKNTQTLTNVAYNASFTWSSTSIRTLEKQMRTPLFGTHPVEMGARGHEREIVRRFRSDTGLAPLFADAFPGTRRPVTMRNIIKAIASFERTLISGRSAYDRMVHEDDALPPEAWRGMKLFFSERLACSSCHRGFNFSGPVQYAGGKPAPAALHLGVLSTRDRFRVPTLRNITLTAPYMHDGSIATLDEVIDRYDAVRALSLSSVEKKELLAFLATLTDEDFVR